MKKLNKKYIIIVFVMIVTISYQLHLNRFYISHLLKEPLGKQGWYILSHRGKTTKVLKNTDIDYLDGKDLFSEHITVYMQDKEFKYIYDQDQSSYSGENIMITMEMKNKKYNSLLISGNYDESLKRIDKLIIHSNLSKKNKVRYEKLMLDNYKKLIKTLYENWW